MVSSCDNKYQQHLQKKDDLMSEYTGTLSYRIKILLSIYFSFPSRAMPQSKIWISIKSDLYQQFAKSS